MNSDHPNDLTVVQACISQFKETIASRHDEDALYEKIQLLMEFLDDCNTQHEENYCLKAIKGALRQFRPQELETLREILDQFKDEAEIIEKIVKLIEHELQSRNEQKRKAEKHFKMAAPPTPAAGLPFNQVTEAEPAPSATDDDVQLAPKMPNINLERLEDSSPNELIDRELTDDVDDDVENDGFSPAPSWGVEKQTEEKREVLIDYFSQMNVFRAYPLVITISKEKIKSKKSHGDILTGEKREQVEKEIMIQAKQPIKVRIIFPGCLVTPSEQQVELLDSSQELKFYITPLAKGKMLGAITFFQENQLIAEFQVKFKVIDQRLAKILALSAMAVSAIPSSLFYLLGIDINQQLTSNLEPFIPILTSPVLLIVELVTSIMLLGLSYIAYKQYSSQRRQLLENLRAGDLSTMKKE